MANNNYNPNARYNMGPNAAGTGRAPAQSVLQAAAVTGMNSDGTMGNGDYGPYFHAHGVGGANSTNTGGNVAGAPRSINNT